MIVCMCELLIQGDSNHPGVAIVRKKNERLQSWPGQFQWVGRYVDIEPIESGNYLSLLLPMVTFPTGVFDLPLSLSTISFRTIEKTRLATH